MPLPREPAYCASPPIKVGLDSKESCQNFGGNAFGLSTILRRKAVVPRWSFSRPMSVWMMHCSWCGRGNDGVVF